jgi:hypothetical protein
MSISTAKQAAFTNTVLGAFAVLGVFGIVGLVLTAMLGLEEPNSTLLVLSSVLLFAAPLATLVHLSVTRDLTREEKRIWIQQLTGRRAAWAFADYLTCHDRRATAKRLVEEALARRRAEEGLPSPAAGSPDKPAGTGR